MNYFIGELKENCLSIYFYVRLKLTQALVTDFVQYIAVYITHPQVKSSSGVGQDNL